MKNYVILSLARGHNGSATLMVDGEIIWYIEEERLSRRKYDGSPLMAMQKAMDFVDHIDELIVCHTHRHGASLDWTCHLSGIHFSRERRAKGSCLVRLVLGS